MILRELRINNFRSYYGESKFEFKDGLTLIIGGNGDGKTTFFDALDWLFATNAENKSETNISERRKSEIEIGENDMVSVSLTFEHNGEKILEKSFRFGKKENGHISTSDFSFQGYDGVGSERIMVAGKVLLERCFDAVIRKYCLFKGESELNVFDNETALKTLVDKFSDIKKFEDFVNLSSEFEKKSDDAYKKELKTDDKVSKKAKELDIRLLDVNRNIANTRSDIKKQEEVARTYQIELETLERHQDTSEKYHEIKERLKTLNEKASKTRSLISEDYNVKLLDNFWILCSFPNIFREYQKKVSGFSKLKRKLNEEYIEQRGKEKGKKEAIEQMTALSNGSAHLPWYMPDDQTMQEMIDDHICKVCNRPAEEGTEAHDFMKERLAQYLKITEEENQGKSENETDKPLFISSFIEELHNLSISFGGSNAKEIANLIIEIKDQIEFNATRKNDLVKIEDQIRDAEEEKQRLLIQSDGLSEEILEKNFKDLRGFFEEKGRAEKKIEDMKLALEQYLEEKKKIDEEYAELTPSKGMVNLYARVHTTFQKIMNAFEGAKKSNLRKFLYDLEERSNEYLKLLNIDDFHGIIKIIETFNESAKIQLYSSNGTYINDPNGALRTTMYMSVLFAISDITTLKREIDYPLIFDAPTSSFESFKENEFYNVIDKINKQCIIITKDLLEHDKNTGTRKLNDEKIKSLTCSVYRIEKDKPFNPNDLSTISTISTHVK